MLRLLLPLIAIALAVPPSFGQDETQSTKRKPRTPSTAVALTPEEQAQTDQKLAEVKTTLFGVGVLGFLCLGLGGLLFTLIPAMNAMLRGHNNTLAIAAVALFLGWTGIGWIVALIWSFTNDTKHTDRYRYGR